MFSSYFSQIKPAINKQSHLIQFNVQQIHELHTSINRKVILYKELELELVYLDRFFLFSRNELSNSQGTYNQEIQCLFK